uniref:SAUR family protein n=1 Tax=Kalanchoe fedtschenkoi TaxID=63787 RepID=A0A7N0V6F1_KALFE
MLQSKMKSSLKRLASKVRCVSNGVSQDTDEFSILAARSSKERGEEKSCGKMDQVRSPSGHFAVYVGEERQRFTVNTRYLTHPLFKMLLEKASDEFGVERRDVLVVPCSVSAFQEVMSAIERCRGRFDFGELVEEFL